MSEVPHMPTKDEILTEAVRMFMEERPGAPSPEEHELKEGSYFERARLKLMSGVRSQLEEYLAYLESEATGIRDELGIKPELPPGEIRELEEQIDVVSVRYAETKKKLREAKETIERLRAVKVPPKIVAAPPTKPLCPAHKVELLPVIGDHTFPWGRMSVPSEMFLFQCSEEFEYYICEPRKACVLISLDKLKLKLMRIIKPPPAPPTVVAPVPFRRPTYPYIPPALEAVEREADFKTYLREVGITYEDYLRLETIGKFVMREEYRRWKAKPYS